MQESVIRKIFEGLQRLEEGERGSEKLNEHIVRFWECEATLKKILSKEQQLVFELYDREHSKVELEREVLSFIRGFKQGMQVGLECLHN